MTSPTPGPATWATDAMSWPTPDQALAMGPARAAAEAEHHLNEATHADVLAAHHTTRADWHRTVAARLAAAYPALHPKERR